MQFNFTFKASVHAGAYEPAKGGKERPTTHYSVELASGLGTKKAWEPALLQALILFQPLSIAH